MNNPEECGARLIAALDSIATIASQFKTQLELPVLAWKQLLCTARECNQLLPALQRSSAAIQHYTALNLGAIQACSVSELCNNVLLEHTGQVAQNVSHMLSTNDPAQLELHIKFGVPVRHILRHASRNQQVQFWLRLVELLHVVAVDVHTTVALTEVTTKLKSIPVDVDTGGGEMSDIIKHITEEQHRLAQTTGAADLSKTKEYMAVVKGLTAFAPPAGGQPNIQDAMQMVSMVQNELSADVDFSTFMKSIAIIAGGLISHSGDSSSESQAGNNMMSQLVSSIGKVTG